MKLQEAPSGSVDPVDLQRLAVETARGVLMAHGRLETLNQEIKNELEGLYRKICEDIDGLNRGIRRDIHAVHEAAREMHDATEAQIENLEDHLERTEAELRKKVDQFHQEMLATFSTHARAADRLRKVLLWTLFLAAPPLWIALDWILCRWTAGTEEVQKGIILGVALLVWLILVLTSKLFPTERVP